MYETLVKYLFVPWILMFNQPGFSYGHVHTTQS